MNFFQVLMLVNTLTSKVSEAMADRKLTIREIVDLAEGVTRDITGKGFNEIGFRIYKKNGKTKIEFEI